MTVLCRPGAWIARQDMPGVRVIESTLARWPTTELKRMAAFCRSEGIGIVHSHMSRAHNFAAILRRLAPVRAVATAHAQYIQLHWRFHDLVLANSSSTAEFHLRYNRIPRSRMKTVYCFADVERFLNARADRRAWYRRELHAPEGRHLICVVGEVVARKGHRHLFDAMPAVLRAVPDAKLVLLGRFHRGEPCTQALRRKQQKLGLWRKVHWLGRRENIHEYLQAMDVCVVPSVVEPLGLVAVEAQAAGVPVIASKTGGLPEVVSHEKTGLLVPSRDPAALAEAIIRLHGDPNLRQQLVTSGRLAAASMFDAARLTEEVIEAYRELLDRNPPG